jgi:chemotaxis-related protein WspB
MLCLTFEVGENWYAIEAQEVIEIIPPVNLSVIPKAPDYFAGRFNYRGTIVPVLDLRSLMMGFPAKRLLSTRIIVVKYKVGEETHSLGLLCEKVMDIIRIKIDELQTPGYITEETSYLGKLINLRKGIVQLVSVKDLLPSFVKNSLFNEHADE